MEGFKYNLLLRLRRVSIHFKCKAPFLIIATIDEISELLDLDKDFFKLIILIKYII